MFHSEEKPNFIPFLGGMSMALTGDGEVVTIEHIISRDPDGELTLHSPELWNQVTESMDYELEKHVVFIADICQSLGISNDLSIRDKLMLIAERTIEDPEQRQIKLNESILAVDKMENACQMINSISIKEGTYAMKNRVLAARLREIKIS